MSKQIRFEIDKKEYTLEYTLKTAAMAERAGLDVSRIDVNPAVQVPLLVNGAFQRWHKGMTRKQTDEIYQQITRKNDFIVALAEMYAEAVNALGDTDDEADAGNANWTLT